ncbi:MAG: glycine zipper 2TM domain-containing protein [Burkholderiales bacterium]
MLKTRSVSLALLLPAAFAVLALAACGKQTPPTSEDPAVQAQIDKDAELKAKEEELAKREAELASGQQAIKDADAAREEQARKDAELALKKRERELAKREAAAAKANAPKPAPAGPRKYTVAAGTSISVQLLATITTKTAKVGDRISATLSNDLVVDGKVIANAGALLQGSVTEVVSGSNKIGGTPSLSLAFDNLVLADGSDTRVSGQITQVAAKSDTGRDTAKIVGGAAAGAIIGHQIDSDKGKIIGGLLGAAAGTAAAKKTGTEVELPAGTVLGFTLNSPVTVEM